MMRVVCLVGVPYLLTVILLLVVMKRTHQHYLAMVISDGLAWQRLVRGRMLQLRNGVCSGRSQSARRHAG